MGVASERLVSKFDIQIRPELASWLTLIKLCQIESENRPDSKRKKNRPKLVIICRSIARLGLNFEDPSIVNIPGIKNRKTILLKNHAQ